MRRRALLASFAGGSAALAGCSLPSSIGGSTDGSDVDPTEYLTFSEAIDETTRERCLRSLEGTVDVVGETPERPVDVEYKEFSTRQASMPPEVYPVARITPGTILPSEQVQVPGALGTYNSQRRALTLADPETVPTSMYSDTDRFPEVSLTAYPSDSLIAHELTHAIQNDVAPDPAPPTNAAGRIADTAISEGTADYVQGLYRQQCLSGERDCATREFQLRPEIVPLWHVLRRFPYRSGAAFVHAAHERWGWDRVWELSRDPPESTWAIMFPDRHFDDDVSIERVSSAPAIDGWQHPTIHHPGALGLYFLLRALGIARVDDPETVTDSAMTDATGIERVYRSDHLSAWRGGGLALYVQGENEPFAIRWTTRWESADAASTAAEAIASAYDERASPDGDGWTVGDAHVVLERSGEALTMASGPDVETSEAIRSA